LRSTGYEAAPDRAKGFLTLPPVPLLKWASPFPAALYRGLLGLVSAIAAQPCPETGEPILRLSPAALAWAWPGDSLHGEGPCDVDAKGAARVTAHLDRMGALREWFEQQPESIRYDWAVRTRLKTEDGVLWEKDIENG
jgi:hypothetical protein